MSHISYFAPPFSAYGNSIHLQSSSLEPSRKRRRESTHSIGDIDNQTIEAPKEPLREGITAQYIVSGQAKAKAVPGHNFPHTSRQNLEDGLQSKSRSGVADELSQLHPPLGVAARSFLTDATDGSGALGLRQQHLTALTATMHKSLLEGQYDRASRAWSMLLRAEHGGQSLDLRLNDRWGLGAEFILHRQERSVEPRNDTDQAQVANGLHEMSKAGYSSQSIEQARDYYERLALQHPHRKVSPDIVDAQVFYYSMFGLWIYSVQEQKPSFTADSVDASDEENEIGPDGWGSHDTASTPNLGSQRSRKLELLRQDTLRRAREIAVRLDELLRSPPYSDNPRFWELLGMVNLWISDLAISSMTPIPRISDMNEGSTLMMQPTRVPPRADIDDSSEQHNKARADAERAFQTANDCYN